MKVPLLDLKPQHQALAGELQDAFTRVLHSGHFILGPEVDGLEREVAAYIGVKHALGVSSGTDALLLALMALDIGPGDEVLCPSFTFFATAGSVARCGAKPVFVDECPLTFNIDVDDIEARITDRTKAIMPVHLFGQCAQMDPIMEIAQRRGIAVIEDAAQALGATTRGRQAGTLGSFGAFSFFPSKNLGALGDAGLLVTNDDALALKARLLRNHGAEQKYFHSMVGGNFRIDALQAAFLRVKLPHLAEYTARRIENAAYYCRGLSAATEMPAPVQIVLPSCDPDNHHVWNQYTIRVIAGEEWQRPELSRDALRAWLLERGIATEIYYPLPLHLQECFAGKNEPKSLPQSENLARECLSLPIHPDVGRGGQDAVIEGILAFLRVGAA